MEGECGVLRRCQSVNLGVAVTGAIPRTPDGSTLFPCHVLRLRALPDTAAVNKWSVGWCPEMRMNVRL